MDGAAASPSRLQFLDGLRGVALILMVVNHTSRDWLDVVMGWPRYHLVYGSLILPAAIFLFLVGFCLPISYHKRGRSEGLVGDFRRYFRRGIGIVAAGYLLNLIMLPRPPVPPEEKLWHGGVLQTIGICIILLGPLVPMLRRRSTRWAMLAAAVLIYLSFGWSRPALARWCAAHPIVCNFATAAIIGLVFMIAYDIWEFWLPTVPRFGFPRDFGLNHYWTPRGVTTFLIITGVAWLLALCYWLMEVRQWRLPWLVTLGQTALVLYFAHQIIEETIVHRALGLRLNNWLLYWTANVALIVLCVYMGRAWQAVKPRVRALVGLQTA